MTEYRTTVSAGDGLDYVLSDGSLDRHGTRINPNGWEIDKRNAACLWSHGRDPAFGTVPIGQWENVRAEGGKLIGRLKLAAKGTSQRIDELISLVEQGIIRAVSVGFEVIEEGKAAGGFDFMRQSLTEASLVAVGSNKNALQMARSLNISESTLQTVFGASAEQDRSVSPGASAVIPPSKVKKMEISLSKRIENAQTELNTARDAYSAHVAEEEYDMEQAETFKAVVEHREARLNSLKDAERTLLLRASAEGESRGLIEAKPSASSGERRPLGIRSKDIEPRELLVRSLTAQILAHGNKKPLQDVLERFYPDHKQTHEYTRAAVDAAKTTVPGWAKELVDTVAAEYLPALNPETILPRLSALGRPLTFGPGRGIIKIPYRTATPSITGSFVAEGAPIPVRKIGLSSIELKPHKLAVISTWTREIAQYSRPTIESMVRSAIYDDTAITLDKILLDATAESATRPAGIIFGVSATTPSASLGYAGILADIQALYAPFSAANAGRKLVLIMNPAQAMALAAVPGPDGTFGWASAFTSQFTILTSTSVSAGNVYLIDAADFVSVTAAPEFDVSDQVTLHMDDTAPLPINGGTPATPVQSMFQQGEIALRMMMDTTWAMQRAGMVQYMTGVAWAPKP